MRPDVEFGLAAQHPVDCFPEHLALAHSSCSPEPQDVAFHWAALLHQDDYFQAAEYCDCFPIPGDFLVVQVEERFRAPPDAEPGLGA